ncbi:MAG: ATP-grasp domain-containing protein [Bacteroidota bacterium]
MQKRVRVVIVFNEPTIKTTDGIKYVTESGLLKENMTRENVVTLSSEGTIDLSEVGVLDELLVVQSAIQSQGHSALLFNMNGDTQRLIHFLDEERPDLVFNLCESVGKYSIHEMHVAAIYELMGIPYTGAGPLTLGSCLNKARTKEILSYHGIPTPRFRIFSSLPDNQSINGDIRFPVIVKPAHEDASTGIDNDSIVMSVESLIKRVRMIFQKYEQSAIVEEYIEGRELNVAIIGNAPPQVLPISEIDFSGLPQGYPHIVTYSAKWHEGTVEYIGTKGVCPAVLPVSIENKIKDIALRGYTILGCRDYARVDIRMTADWNLYVLEVNPNPDLSPDAGFARSIRGAGMCYEEGIGRIITYALERTSSL